MLIACCPGGSSSNIFSMLAKGDVALSVSLTAVSSIITLFTVPIIMEWTTEYVGAAVGVHLPVGNLLMQNLITMLLPIILGILCRLYFPTAATNIDEVLSKLAFPALSDKDVIDSDEPTVDASSAKKQENTNPKKEVADLPMGELVLKAKAKLEKKGVDEKEITYKALKDTILHMQKWTVPERRAILNYFIDKEASK